MPKFLLLFYSLVFGSAFAADEAVIHHALGDWSPEIRRYQIALLEAGLKASESKFGPVRAEFSSASMTPSRWRMFFSGGKIQSTMVTVQQLDVDEGEGGAKAVLLPFPVLNLQLGLRHLVIRKDFLPRFANVKSLQDLQALRPGQGAHWPEVAIYRHSGIDVGLAEQFTSLLAMLDRKRFDYIPLSVLESKATLMLYKEVYPDLQVVDGLYVFYPLPLYIAVNTSDKDALLRLKYVVEWLLADQRYQEIYREVFGDEGEVLDADDIIITLDNPLYAKSESDELTRHFFSGARVMALPEAPRFLP